MIRLGVLDQSPVSEGSSGAEALRNTVDLARLTEGLGYGRYWVAEHHGPPLLASASPEALIGAVAAATSGMRVGSGGVMLPHYSPLKVAESFSVLAALFPGRIDLGIGRAAGTDPTTAYALLRNRQAGALDDFPQQLAELVAYLRDEIPDEHPFRGLAALPGLPEAPEFWLLGSSAQSAIWAAELGVPYAFADFISAHGADHVAHYREHYQPSAAHPEPRVIVAASAICADSDDEARDLATSITMAMRLLRRGRPIPVPPVEEARRFVEEEAARRRARGNAGPPRRRARRMVVGAPATVRAGLEEVAEEYGAQELLVVTITHDHDARRRSYELIAEAAGLTPPSRRAR